MNLNEQMKEIKRLTNITDGFSDELVDAIKKYQKEYERLLLKTEFDLNKGYMKPTAKNYNKVASLNAMNKLGFEDLGIAHIKNYNQIAKNQIEFNSTLLINMDMKFSDISIVTRLKEIDLAALYSQAEGLNIAIKKNLINGIATSQKYSTIVEGIASDLLGMGDTLGKLERYADTYMRTSLFGLGRMIDKEIYDKTDDFDKYMYVGPIDGHTREFCLEHAGNIYTKDEIDEFPEENDSGLDPWFSPGGFGCRHRLVPIGDGTKISLDEVEVEE